MTDYKELENSELIKFAIDNGQFDLTATARHTLIRKLKNKQIAYLNDMPVKQSAKAGLEGGVRFSGFAASFFLNSNLSASK